MADTHDHGGHNGSLFKTYMTIAGILAVCTAASFLFNQMVYWGMMTAVISFTLILTVAIVKASLVGTIFMHLKWDWRLLYFIIIPAFILGAMMIVILLPDIVIGPNREAEEAVEMAKKYQEELAVKP